MLTAFCAPLAAGASALVAAPEYLAATIVLIASVGLYVNGLMRAEVRHRGESVLDPLTGLLNRATLDQRYEEVRQQAILAHVPVAFVLFDLDHFKAVNDTYGHETGDAVLRDVAYGHAQVAAVLRARLPGRGRGAAAHPARAPTRPRPPGSPSACACTVAASRPGGISVTISAGDQLRLRRRALVRAPLRACRRPAVRGQARRPQPRRPEPARDERLPATRGLSGGLSGAAQRERAAQAELVRAAVVRRRHDADGDSRDAHAARARCSASGSPPRSLTPVRATGTHTPAMVRRWTEIRPPRDRGPDHAAQHDGAAPRGLGAHADAHAHPDREELRCGRRSSSG